MNSIQITMADGVAGFAPGAVVEGTVEWQRDDRPRNAVLRLFWYTQGKGTVDVGIVQEVELPSVPVHREEFRLQLPAAPYSFTGQLVAVLWAIEATLDNGAETARVNLVVSPWTEAPNLEKVEDKDGPVMSVAT